jgi:hypothetical protein
MFEMRRITWTDSTAEVVTLVIPRKSHSLADSIVGTMPLVTGVNSPYKKFRRPLNGATSWTEPQGLQQISPGRKAHGRCRSTRETATIVCWEANYAVQVNFSGPVRRAYGARSD